MGGIGLIVNGGPVGIGTETPTQNLDVTGTTILCSDNAGQLIIGGQNHATGEGAEVVFTGSPGNPYITIDRVTGGSGLDEIRVFTHAGQAAPTWQMSIFNAAAGNADLYVEGKLTSGGGNDPPYVAFSMETRQSIIERVAKEIPEDKMNQAVQFWNEETDQFEIYLPPRGEFRNLQGELVHKL
jgi:hypothetical protein